MYCYKLTIAYEGTHYNGWQVQPNAPSIQAHLLKALKILLDGQEVALTGSGRTDTGVHARGQVAHFKWEALLDLQRLQFSLNGLLPRDIRIKKIELAVLDFHSRYSAIGKEYHYHLYLDRVMDPFQRLYCWHIHHKLDLSLLREAASQFLGIHDFTSFANEAHRGAASYDPIRTLYRLDIKDVEGGLCLEFEGDGFLYKMVRNIVGNLVEIATCKRKIETISSLFSARDRCQVGQAAPALGLFLIRVDYPSDHLL